MRKNSLRLAIAMVLGAALWAGVTLSLSVSAQTANPATAATKAASGSAETAAPDLYQRSYEIYNYRSTATSGPQRGEELYFYKCWMCHNQYAKSAPLLKGIYTRTMAGQPVTDESLAEKIKLGSPVMPAFGTTMKNADVADLVAYIKSDGCCFDAENPPPNPRFRAKEGSSGHVPVGKVKLGGAHGVVTRADGMLLEGVAVQLISGKTAVRTTVYTNKLGRYEFPLLEKDTYTLRIARPVEFKPWVKEGVAVSGAPALDDIVLTRQSNSEFLPPTAEVVAQLSGVEWLMNMPGTAEEKKVFSNLCTHCHSYQQIMRNRYDEPSWRAIVRRMTRGGGSPLINQSDDRTPLQVAREELLVKFLTRVRGPDAKDPPILPLPFPRGASTRVVVTEYELPRGLLSPHDVHADKEGNIWYTAHRSPFNGALDPKTGKVREYRVPATLAEDTKGALPGTHRVWVDDKDVVWFSEQWDHFMTGLDAKTGKQLKRFKLTERYRINSSGYSNFAMDKRGYAYETDDLGNMIRLNTNTGEVKEYKFPGKITGTYDNIITPDGRYWAGGGSDMFGMWDLKNETYNEFPARTPFVSYSRGAFDKDGNAWLTGRGSGLLVKLDMKTNQMYEYNPPVPYATAYEAMPDKKGDVWIAVIQSGIMFRFTPKTEKWVGYRLPEPYSHNRRAWIDNSTNPVSVWYVDHNGYMVRIQPLD
jgi:streptogramin lyase/cytochrome c5